ncbi:hypothetical protein SAMD00019534_088270 [Acytostelium subglobosum LB1]|uniref:hypothetical protein n=1 Tax=Acytostelium subglobosum LB1 TaxID=1410327 RepID=UPI000644D130|nr:hypothetical protein SAMD00019534_088270 [Acytostelium subglobosum LB1]GAM25652.1 hypothetical protein SAMD00019534_088270 [Acytostelium subglobosum LB1]|eukprot:XP_012751638.1 hypothetical protein SAMD00019534_088270 [Acytostelium subglobosum LB1]
MSTTTSTLLIATLCVLFTFGTIANAWKPEDVQINCYLNSQWRDFNNKNWSSYDCVINNEAPMPINDLWLVYSGSSRPSTMWGGLNVRNATANIFQLDQWSRPIRVSSRVNFGYTVNSFESANWSVLNISRLLSSEEQMWIAIDEIRLVAQDAKAIAMEARTIATEAKNIAADAKNISNEAKAIAADAKSIAAEANIIAAEAKAYSMRANNLSTETQPIANEAKNIALLANSASIEAALKLAEAQRAALMNQYLIQNLTATQSGDMQQVMLQLQTMTTKAKEEYEAMMKRVQEQMADSKNEIIGNMRGEAEDVARKILEQMATTTSTTTSPATTISTTSTSSTTGSTSTTSTEVPTTTA